MENVQNVPPRLPPDYERCQSQIKATSIMTFGPEQWVRCQNKPAVIATENRPGVDGQRGSMSLCEDCLKVMKAQLGEEHATIKAI